MHLTSDRVSKFTCAEFKDDLGKMNGADFLHGVIQAFPYKIDTVLTENSMAFADLTWRRVARVARISHRPGRAAGARAADR